MDKQTRSVSSVFMQIALALIFIVSGVTIIRYGLRAGDEVVVAFRSTSFLKGDVTKILCYIYAVIELIAGVFLFIRLFVVMGTGIDTIFMVIISICWIIAIVFVDFVSKSTGIIFNTNPEFIFSWLSRFAIHLLILAAIIRVRY
ncbi:MAG: hypothetical protein HUK25_02720 [Treponema sp.]|nr:hypothetical protein [Treponema sp.]